MMTREKFVNICCKKEKIDRWKCGFRIIFLFFFSSPGDNANFVSSKALWSRRRVHDALPNTILLFIIISVCYLIIKSIKKFRLMKVNPVSGSTFNRKTRYDEAIPFNESVFRKRRGGKNDLEPRPLKCFQKISTS